jgi:hypothetical protein
MRAKSVPSIPGRWSFQSTEYVPLDEFSDNPLKFARHQKDPGIANDRYAHCPLAFKREVHWCAKRRIPAVRDLPGGSKSAHFQGFSRKWRLWRLQGK